MFVSEPAASFPNSAGQASVPGDFQNAQAPHLNITIYVLADKHGLLAKREQRDGATQAQPRARAHTHTLC